MARFGDVGPYAPWNCEIIECGENVRRAHLGKKLTLKQRKAISDRMIGKQFFLGKRHTEEAKAKIANKLRGRSWGKHTTEAKIKMSEAGKGRKSSEDHKRNISRSMIGNKNALGNNHSNKSREKMSKSMKASWKRRKESGDQRRTT